jgi:hypothetical protein
MVSGNCSNIINRGRMLWESVVNFAESLQPQSPFEEALYFCGKE